MIHYALSHLKQGERGFTLLEMAIVMVIISFLLAGVLMPLATQRDLANRKEAEQQLKDIHDALIGFAITNGRLPCPAPYNGDGEEEPVGGGNCTNNPGAVPGRTLGINGSFNSNGGLLDPWHREYRYQVTTVGGNAWTTANGITLSVTQPDLQVCDETPCGAILSSNVAAVILSDGNDTTGSARQAENQDGDTLFVSRSLTESTANAFDDVLHWVSPNAITVQLVRSGKLD